MKRLPLAAIAIAAVLASSGAIQVRSNLQRAPAADENGCAFLFRAPTAIQVDQQSTMSYLKGLLLRRSLDFLVPKVTQDFSNRVIVLNGVSVELGERMGFGISGSFYPIIKHSADPGWDSLDPNIKYGIKIPHFMKWGRKSSYFPRKLVKEEAGHYESYSAWIGDASANAKPWRDGHWLEGQLPLVPAALTIETEEATYIVKPILRAKQLKQIKKEDGLEEKHWESLKELIDFRVWLKATHGIPLDVNPENLYWVDDPPQMRACGITRPGFVLIEFGEFPDEKVFRGGMTWDDYVVWVRDVD